MWKSYEGILVYRWESWGLVRLSVLPSICEETGTQAIKMDTRAPTSHHYIFFAQTMCVYT